MNVNAGNVFESIPESISEELFTAIIDNDTVKIERIVSRGHVSPDSGWHDQDENEWVIVIKGEAKILFYNGSSKHLMAGSHINIPANTRHKVIWTKPDTETIWLAVHYK